MGPDQRQQAVGLCPGAEQRVQQRLQHGTPSHKLRRTKAAIAIWSEHTAAVGHGIDQLRHELAQLGRESPSVARDGYMLLSVSPDLHLTSPLGGGRKSLGRSLSMLMTFTEDHVTLLDGFTPFA